MDKEKANTRDRIFKFISFIIGIFAVILTIGKTFDEGTLISKILNNAAYFYLEIPIILFVSIFLYFYDFFTAKILAIHKRLLKNKIRYRITVILIIIFIVGNFDTITSILKERLHHVKQWQNPDKYNSYKKICLLLRQCKYDIAEKEIKIFASKYPEERPELNQLIDDLNKSKNIANGLFYLNEFFEDDLTSYRQIDRINFLKSLTAYSYFPTLNHKRLIKHELKIIKEGLNEAEKFYYAVWNLENEYEAVEIYQKWHWFLFDNYINQKISSQSLAESKIFFQKLTSHIKKEDFISTLEQNWRIDIAEELLEWKPEVYVGKSWEYYATD